MEQTSSHATNSFMLEAIGKFLDAYPVERAEQLLERWCILCMTGNVSHLHQAEVREVFDFLERMEELVKDLNDIHLRGG